MNDLLFLILAVFIVIATVFASVFGLVYFANSIDCAAYMRVTGNETKMSGTNCYGKIDGKWYRNYEYNKLYVPNRTQLETK